VKRNAIAVLVVAGAIGLMVWRRSGSPALQHAICRDCNVLLVTIDTLRADRVGAFGGPSGLTPTLDSLAARGVKLTRAYTVAPLTLPAHTSILTAVSPPVHGVRANGLFRLGARLPTLATVLKQSGYRTAAFVGSFVLDARFGLNRGFDDYDDRYGEKHAGDDTEGAERRAEDVIKPATDWILNGLPNPQSSPQSAIRNPQWFAWVHLYDPHEPYRAPEPYASRFPPYDAEVAYTDAMVGKLLADLTAARQLDRTLVVVVADHGESLGEHAERSHGVFAYDATLHVPWIVWAGDRLTNRAWNDVARLIDVAPTILDLIGSSPPAEFEGRSIVESAGDSDRARAAYFEAIDANLTRNWAPLTGIVSSRFKLIDLPIPELYDLGADPQELNNLFDRDGERARTLQALLQAKTKEFAARGSAAERTTLSADARQRLQALGYVATTADAGAHRTYTEADDPKRLIAAANDLNRALADFKAGAAAQAMSAVRDIIQVHPSFTTAYGVLASMQRDSGDLGAAIGTLDAVVRRGTADQSVLLVLADYLQEAGALPKAAALLEALVAGHSDYADAQNSLGVVYSRMGRHQEAQAAFRRVLDLDPTSATAYENRGVDAMGAGDLAGAVASLRHALELDPRLARAHNVLAAAYLRQRRTDEAFAEWKAALDLEPRMYDALYNLGISLWDTGRRDEARPHLERFIREAPAQRYATDIQHVRTLLERTQRAQRTQR
jgi:arylsulfatase A-like enzyme/Tfp pilus assembly protein PilF